MNNQQLNPNATVSQTPQEKLNMTSTIAYAIGSCGANISFYMINNYLMLFYTDVVGLAASAISLIMLIARIWDAVNDPMMGLIEDRTHTKLGKFRPWLIVGPPFLAVFNILTFTVFPLHGVWKTIVCAICYIGAGMAYTVVQVAINGLVNRITNISEKKMTVISIAQIANQIGSTLIAAVLMPVILFFSKSDVANATGYFWGTLFMSVITLPMIWIAAWKCKEVTTVDEELFSNGKPKKSLRRSLKVIFSNDQLVIAVLTTFLSCISIIGRFALLSYYLIYVVGSYALIAPVFSVMSFAQMVGNIPIPFLTGKFGKRNVYIAANLASALAMILLFFVPGGSNLLVIILSAIIGLLGASGSIGYAFVCDCVEYGDWKYGIRDDGLAFSMMSFSVKLASAFTGAIGIPLLVAVGYVAGEVQTAQTCTAINVIVNLLPAAILILSLIPLFKYKLDKKTMNTISAELEKRRNTNTNN